jgi:membrane protease YdiL (CAAX protease family)
MTLPQPAGFVPRRAVLRIAFLGEGLLIVGALAWILLRDLSIPVSLSRTTIAQALALTCPLVLLNLYVFLGPAGPRFRHPSWRIFADQFVRPLCADLTPGAALVVSLLAGLGEELLFRGVLLTELRPWCGDGGAVLISGILFGWVHFLSLWQRFIPVVLAYCFFGIVLGSIYLCTNDLTLLILVHAFYNFAVILAVRRDTRRSGGRAGSPQM